MIKTDVFSAAVIQTNMKTKIKELDEFNQTHDTLSLKWIKQVLINFNIYEKDSEIDVETDILAKSFDSKKD